MYCIYYVYFLGSTPGENEHVLFVISNINSHTLYTVFNCSMSLKTKFLGYINFFTYFRILGYGKINLWIESTDFLFNRRVWYLDNHFFLHTGK